MKKFIWVLSIAFALSVIVVTCTFEITTANIKNIKLCSSLSGELCDQDIPLFHPGDPQIVVSCQLKNAPEDTDVTFIWKYIEGEPIVIDQVTLNSSEYGINVDMHSSLSRPNSGWPVGKYQVEIIVGGDEDSPDLKIFEVK